MPTSIEANERDVEKRMPTAMHIARRKPQNGTLSRASSTSSSNGSSVSNASAGATIPLGKSGYKRDYTGQVIRTTANETLLRNLAEAGGGAAVSLSDADALKTLSREVGGLQKSAVEARAYTEYVSYFQWLLLPVLLLLMLEQVLWWRKKS